MCQGLFGWFTICVREKHVMKHFILFKWTVVEDETRSVLTLSYKSYRSAYNDLNKHKPTPAKTLASAQQWKIYALASCI